MEFVSSRKSEGRNGEFSPRETGTCYGYYGVVPQKEATAHLAKCSAGFRAVSLIGRSECTETSHD